MAKKKEFRYVLPKLKEHEFDRIDKGQKARVVTYIDERDGVSVIGNSEGLLYLAKHFAAMALHKNQTGLHIHLEPGEEVEKGSLELTNVPVPPPEPPGRDRNTANSGVSDQQQSEEEAAPVLRLKQFLNEYSVLYGTTRSLIIRNHKLTGWLVALGLAEKRPAKAEYVRLSSWNSATDEEQAAAWRTFEALLKALIARAWKSRPR